MPKFQPSRFNLPERDEIERLAIRAAAAVRSSGPPAPLPDVATLGYWTPITNGDPLSPEILFDAEGNCIVGWVATPE